MIFDYFFKDTIPYLHLTSATVPNNNYQNNSEKNKIDLEKTVIQLDRISKELRLLEIQTESIRKRYFGTK